MKLRGKTATPGALAPLTGMASRAAALEHGLHSQIHLEDNLSSSKGDRPGIGQRNNGNSGQVWPANPLFPLVPFVTLFPHSPWRSPS